MHSIFFASLWNLAFLSLSHMLIQWSSLLHTFFYSFFPRYLLCLLIYSIPNLFCILYFIHIFIASVIFTDTLRSFACSLFHQSHTLNFIPNPGHLLKQLLHWCHFCTCWSFFPTFFTYHFQYTMHISSYYGSTHFFTPHNLLIPSIAFNFF